MVFTRLVLMPAFLLVAATSSLLAQQMEDGSDAIIGKADARIVLDLIAERFRELDPKVNSLRKAEGSWVCGSVNVKNRDGLYTGDRGFVADIAARSFGRVPDGPEMLSPKSEGFVEKERIRQLYFNMCLEHTYN